MPNSQMPKLTAAQFGIIKTEAESKSGYVEAHFDVILASLKERQLIIRATSKSTTYPTEAQFHTVWTEAVGKEGYEKHLFQEVLSSLKEKGHILA
jgi:hypothetical protein